jgi:hypothetical protein
MEARARVELLGPPRPWRRGPPRGRPRRFARGLARAPLSPSVQRSAAYLRIRSGVDPERAEEDVDRAIGLEARRGDSSSPESRRAQAFVEAQRKGK